MSEHAENCHTAMTYADGTRIFPNALCSCGAAPQEGETPGYRCERGHDHATHEGAGMCRHTGPTIPQPSAESGPRPEEEAARLLALDDLWQGDPRAVIGALLDQVQALREELAAEREAHDDTARGRMIYEREMEQELSTLRAKVEALEQVVEIAANTCGDVTTIGRFARSVDPVRWVEQLQAHLRAALSEKASE